MKRIFTFFITFLLCYTTAEASHVLGGEISWRCLSNGRYVFFMQVYRDCTGIPFNFQDENLTLVGNPLPTNGVTSILVKADRNRFNNNRNGDTSPYCTPQYGREYNCPSGDEGTVQAFYYQSDPIVIQGRPGSGGWRIYWQSPCCRPGLVENVNTMGSMLLRAIMYPGPNGVGADPCYDSSPVFRALPTTLICRNYEFTYNHTAIDIDLDELIYSWDRPYNPPFTNPLALNYKPGFSPTNPTPDATRNINNIPASLDPLTGITRLAVYSGTGTKKYITVVKVDSYREGVKVATVYREIPINFFDCPPLPNGLVNNVPEVEIDGVPTRSVITDIIAGQSVSIPVQVVDNDITGIGTQLQILSLVPDGLLFTNNKRKDFPCEVPGLEPCAYLRNADPSLNTAVDPNTDMIQGLGVIGTEFVWDTRCHHISSLTGFPGTNEGVYNFVMRVFDDHCPIPALNYPTITIRVKDPIPMTEPIVKGISVGLDGSTTVNYVAAVDSSTDLGFHEIHSARPLAGAAPTVWTLYDDNVTNYIKDHKEPMQTFPVYDFINQLDPTQGPKLPDPFGTRNGTDFDFYVRMRSVSGCTDTIPSIWSQPARVMELNITPIGVFPDPINSRVRLDWNRPKPLNANTYNYYAYESQTLFNIWANDSVSQGKIADPTAWYRIGSTYGTSFELNATTCDDFVAFRIEAVDSVDIPKQGSAPRHLPDSIEPVVFSTFSLLDTVKMKTNSFIPDPKFDTLEVRLNGTIFVRIDPTNKATTSTYNNFNGTPQTGTLLASVAADEDSVVLSLNALNQDRQITLQALDGCDANNITESNQYTTYRLNGQVGAACSGEYIIDWQAPSGFPVWPQQNAINNTCTGVKGFHVYVDSTSNGAGTDWVLLSTIPTSTLTRDTLGGIKRSTTYMFRVAAYDCEGAVIISAPLTYNSPAVVAKPDLVPAPTPRCTYVNNNGSVLLSWIRAVDTVDNFGAYQIEYRQAGATNWTNVPGVGGLSRTDESFTITGINAQNQQYEFRLTTLAGCDGTSPSNYETINSVYITATPRLADPQKRGDIMWNPTGVDYGNLKFFNLFKGDVGVGYNSPFLTSDVQNTNMAVDDANSESCDDTYDYYVSLVDSIFKPVTGFVCTTRSNLTNARYQDTIPPDAQNLTHVSYDVDNESGVIVYWENNTGRYADSMRITTTDGFNSGLQNYRDLTPQSFLYNQQFGFNGEQYDSLISNTVLDASDSAVVYASRIIDACGNQLPESLLHFHKTMEVEAVWNICDSVNELNWNHYVGFDTAHQVNYEVYYRTSSAGIWQATGDTIRDSSYNHLIIQGGFTYQYHVKAFTAENPTYISNSNVERVYSIYESVPRYGYLQHATVLPTNDVEIRFYRDTLIFGKGYTLLRGKDKLSMQPLEYIASTSLNSSEDTILYLDERAEVSDYSYYYQVVTENACDILVDESNFGRTIHLSVDVDNAALTNELRWNRYEEWDSTVAFYNIYRQVDDSPLQMYAVAAPNSRYRINSFQDDVYDEVFSKGKFCYRVEAVQGPIDADAVNGYPHSLESATSSSNTVCVVVKPLFYIPNAFAPGGVNRTFKPKGQFLDFEFYEMSIYNRWGEQVFITRNINEGWDGTVNGTDASLGSYVYMIRFKDAQGNNHRRKGTVTLIK